jgi:hypothetical protein
MYSRKVNIFCTINDTKCSRKVNIFHNIIGTKCSRLGIIFCTINDTTNPRKVNIFCTISFQIINMYSIKVGLQNYCDTSYWRCGVNQLLILKISKDLLEYIQFMSRSSAITLKQLTSLPSTQLFLTLS